MDNKDKILGILAEFESVAQLLDAAKKVRQAGYIHFDCFSPFPVHGMDEAMGLKRSPLGWMVGLMAIFGALLAIIFQWWTSTIDYRLIISGKPFFSYQAFVPVTFGVAVLLAALTAFFGMLFLNKLPQLHHPNFYSKNFEKVTDDRFFISIDAKDKMFDEMETFNFINQINGKNIELLKNF